MIRVVVADDHPLARTGLAALLAAEPDMTVVAQAEDGRDAAAAAREHEADVVLLDLEMPGTGGVDGTRMVAQARPQARVLVVTTFDLDEYVVAALRAGASGFLLKTAPADQIALAVRQVHAGAMLFDPGITHRLVETYLGAAERRDRSDDVLAPLTARERDVFDLLARGRSNAEIAETLVLGEPTVKTHVTRVLDKLGVRDRVQVVVLAYESGYLAPPPGR
ncbi:DNA-binding NarL/FixJ family response regulator [Mumia flava]|uniref:DNA-binding NarL/FixJ family response regulator n=1 Tax=Mumia flava TaxID=1348852 RepID=A0A0B2B720_9ACTN|nr:response regulator transcription factor [Mumia flava]PJJ57898.1 DNA-binding NarL/FixJ family response regulator [Mumia flava]